MKLSPNTVNSVPRGAVLEIDIRDIDRDRRDGVVRSVQDRAAEIAKRRGVRHSFEVVNQDPPATCDDQVGMQCPGYSLVSQFTVHRGLN